jgi:hypothetical protein
MNGLDRAVSGVSPSQDHRFHSYSGCVTITLSRRALALAAFMLTLMLLAAGSGIAVARTAATTLPTAKACVTARGVLQLATSTGSCRVGSRVVLNQRGPQGFTGPRGLTGAPGAKGLTGAPGPAAKPITYDFDKTGQSTFDVIDLGNGYSVKLLCETSTGDVYCSVDQVDDSDVWALHGTSSCLHTSANSSCSDPAVKTKLAGPVAGTLAYISDSAVDAQHPYVYEYDDLQIVFPNGSTGLMTTSLYGDYAGRLEIELVFVPGVTA